MVRTVRHVSLVSAIVLGVAVSACGHSSNTAPTSNTDLTQTPVFITVGGLGAYTRVGIKAQYVATALFSDNTSRDVSGQATWMSSNPSRLPITSTGLTMYIGGSGGALITATYKGVSGAEPIALDVSGEDCGSYTPSAIAPATTSDGFIVTDGRQIFFSLDTVADAQNATTLMQGYSSVCFVGRSNPRPNREAYIFQYFKPAGPPPALSNEDCVAYDPASLAVDPDPIADGIVLADRSSRVALLDNLSDAYLLLSVAKQYSARCYIGRGNTRPDPLAYIVQYWK